LGLQIMLLQTCLKKQTDVPSFSTYSGLMQHHIMKPLHAESQWAENGLMLAFQYACCCLTFWHTVHQAESVAESEKEIIVKLFHLVLPALLDLKELFIIIVIIGFLRIRTVNSV